MENRQEPKDLLNVLAGITQLICAIACIIFGLVDLGRGMVTDNPMFLIVGLLFAVCGYILAAIKD